MKELIHLINNAYSALRNEMPMFNPIKGHVAGEDVLGSSHFHKGIESADELLRIMFEHREEITATVKPGRHGALCIIVQFIGTIGEEARPVINDKQNYKIVRDHGDLVATCDDMIKCNYYETSIATFVLTPEKTAYDTVFMLASCYPGLPDPEGDWSNLNEGDVVTGAELKRRIITRVKNLK